MILFLSPVSRQAWRVILCRQRADGDGVVRHSGDILRHGGGPWRTRNGGCEHQQEGRGLGVAQAFAHDTPVRMGSGWGSEMSVEASRTYLIGHLCREFGVAARTLRHYEELHQLAPQAELCLPGPPGRTTPTLRPPRRSSPLQRRPRPWRLTRVRSRPRPRGIMRRGSRPQGRGWIAGRCEVSRRSAECRGRPVTG